MKLHRTFKRGSGPDEEGNIVILGLGYVVVVLILVLLLVHIGGLYLERKRWQGVADSAALTLSDARVVQNYLDSLPSEARAEVASHTGLHKEDPREVALRFVETARLIKSLPVPRSVEVSTATEPAAVSIAATGGTTNIWMLGAQMRQSVVLEVRSQAINSE